jgi:hypothetical protein
VGVALTLRVRGGWSPRIPPGQAEGVTFLTVVIGETKLQKLLGSLINFPMVRPLVKMFSFQYSVQHCNKIDNVKCVTLIKY